MADGLISKQQVCEVLAQFAPENYTRLVEMLVVKLPGVDAVPVVRCGKCMHRHTRPTCHGRGPDWFCADGARRPGAERREENAAD